MNRLNYFLLLLSLPTLFIFSCASSNQTSKDELEENSIVQISWGTSFGMCRGYCYKEYIITKDSLRSLSKSWDAEKNPPIDTTVVSNFDWAKLISSSNYNEFIKLDTRIGCPDCADGGAEWIEMKTSSGASHKVLYDFGSTPKGLESLLSYLRNE